MKNYIKKIRAKIGHDLFIHPAARILVENDKGQFLFNQRTDNGYLGIPAGALEEGETIEECIIREVQEETGIQIQDPVLIGISSNPATETVTYPNGDNVQYFSIEFYCNTWHGEINIHDHKEIASAAFLDATNLNLLPVNERSIVDSLHYYLETGNVRVK